MGSQILFRPLPYLALILAFIIWGITIIVAKITLKEIPPMSLAFLRFALASLFLVPFFLIQKKKVKIAKEDLPKIIAIGVLSVTISITLFFEGLIRTSAINASMLNMIIPSISVLLGWLIFKERIYLVNLVGIFSGLIGILIIFDLPQFLFGSYSFTALFGNLLIILSAVSWVTGGIFAKEMLKKYPSLIITATAFLIGTITFFLPAAKEYFDHPDWVGKVTLVGYLGLFYITLLSSISAFFLYEWGLARTSINKANLFQYIEPFVASTTAFFVLGEQFSPPFLFGAILIMIGVYFGTLAKEPHHKTHKIHRF